MVRKSHHCSVLTCVNYYNILKETCYSFPRNKKIAEDWVRAINNPNLDIEEAHNYHKNKYVCHRHFATCQYNTPERLRLNRGVVPTLFLPSSDNSESGPSASQIHKVVLSSVRYDTIYKFAEPALQDETDIKEETDVGACEDDESHLPHLDIRMQNCEHNNVKDSQMLQEDEGRVEVPVQEDSQSEDILTASSMPQHFGSNGTQVTLVDDTVANLGEVAETCDAPSYHGDTDEYQDVKFFPNEPCTVATDTWEDLPHQLCRLCASTDEHPKQSIVGWLGMLNEIIPDLVALNDGLPQHVCRPCTNKLYTCNRIKVDFIEAYNKLQETLGFTKSSGIQFMDLPPAVSDHETLDNVTEEQLVSEDPSEGLSRLMLSSHKDLIEDKEMTLNTVDDLSLTLEESVVSDTDDEAVLYGNFTQDRSDIAHNTSSANNIQIQQIRRRKNEKYKYVCGECEEMFTKKGALNAHRHTHAKVFECEYCNKKFTSIDQLDDHRYIHTKELPFMCEVCGKCFRNMARLKSHEYVHKPPRYTCQVCNKKFRSNVYLTQHKKGHCADARLICELCGKMLYTLSTLQIHLRIHTGEKPFQCAVCGKCFISAGRLRIHRFLHTDKKFKCDTCAKEFHLKKSLIQHQKCHTKLKHYKCPICFREFSNSHNRKRHRKLNCKQPICIVCNETFLTDDMVEEHRTKEHSEEEVAVAAKHYRERYLKCCPVCSQAISGKGNMLKHVKEYHRDYSYKPFACEQCSKTFSTAGILRTHRIWHSEQRSFVCATCGKRFKTKNTLKWHDLSVHQNEHPFHCPYCGRQFKRLSDLIVHKRKHTGERPFPCPICMQKFFTKSDMLKHAKKHSQSSANVAWKEVVEGTLPIGDIVFSSPDLSCDIGAIE